jgi:DNA-directed RNA polymerase subunit E'/Rpb7
MIFFNLKKIDIYYIIMDNIFFNSVLTKKIVVEAKYLNENIDEYINNYLKKKVEGKCIDEGYVEPDSVKILKKSVGMLLGSRFTGDVTYEIFYTANVCNPVIGNVIDCKVKFINKLGILGHNGAITIIVGKQFQINNDSLSKIKENDIIKVEVIAKKFYLNDSQIKIIAKLWNEDNKNDLNKTTKKDITASDLTPIISDNEYFDNEQLLEDNNYNIDDNYEMSEDDSDLDDDNSEENEEEKIEIKNPAELDVGDIEMDDFEDEEDEEDEEDDDNGSINEY